MGIKLPNCELILVYIRKLKGKQDNFFSSVVKISITNNLLTIESHQIIKTESRLQFNCSFLQGIELYNQSFYLFDKNKKTTLCAYNSSRLPLIIGHKDVDSIERAESKGINYVS
jgi:hypothetical protein